MIKRNLGWVKLFGLVLVLGLVLTACGQKKSSSSADKSPIVVATSGTLYPTSYHDQKTDKLTGFDVEIVKAVGKKTRSQGQVHRDERGWPINSG